MPAGQDELGPLDVVTERPGPVFAAALAPEPELEAEGSSSLGT